MTRKVRERKESSEGEEKRRNLHVDFVENKEPNHAHQRLVILPLARDRVPPKQKKKQNVRFDNPFLQIQSANPLLRCRYDNIRPLHASNLVVRSIARKLSASDTERTKSGAPVSAAFCAKSL